jgi:hypothetical protein
MFDFFFFFTIRFEEGLLLVDTESDERCLDHSFCRSRLHRLLKFEDAIDESAILFAFPFAAAAAAAAALELSR